MVYRKSCGGLLCRESFDNLHQAGTPFLALPHHDLHQILERKVRQVPVHRGCTIQQFQLDSRGVDVVLNNGEKWHGDLLLACDGIHSQIRQTIYPDITLSDLGLFCWRFITEKPEGIQTDPQLFFGRNSAFLIYPMINNRVYCYGHIADSCTKSLPDDKAREELQSRFDGYYSPVRSVLTNLPPSIRLICGRMQVMPKSVWGGERALILGDAAHGCGPILQQGVAQGLEDASLLTEELNKTEDLNQALHSFIFRRSARVNWVGNYSNTKLKDLSSTEEISRNESLKQNGPIHTCGWKQLFAMPL